MAYFKPHETQCKCGCGMDVSPKLLKALNEARRISGVPFTITSGARCAEHNRMVGGKPNSAHVRGLAVDIACQTSTARFAILKGLFYAGFNRIGYNQARFFFHADIDESLPQNVFFEY